MDAYECPVCYESCYHHPERKLFHSDICKHRICGTCLNLHFGAGRAGEDKTAGGRAAGGGGGVSSNERRGFCPVCRAPSTRSNYRETDPDMEIFEIEKEVRKRVESIYNSTRDRFTDTPAYDDYREKKEEIVFQLVNGTDEALKRKLEAELRAHEKQNSKIIMENREMLKQREKEKIRRIVQREGVFYEVVKQRVALSRNAVVDKDQLTHPLERQYAAYFRDEQGPVAAATPADGIARPLNPSIKEDGDIPKPRYKNREQFERAGIAGGYTQQMVFANGMQELLGSFAALLDLQSR